MTTRYSSPANARERVLAVINAWQQLPAKSAQIAEHTVADMAKCLTEYDNADLEVKKYERLLNKARSIRREKRRAMWELVQRIRKGIFATFGGDSVEYANFGGTRVRDRKSPTKRKANDT